MNHDKDASGADASGSAAIDARPSATPHVLLVEDDPVSAAFLRDAVAAYPAHVTSATTAAEALRLASERDFDLWLIDAHLPDGRGVDVIERLRAQGRTTPALAHTAETAKTVLDGLIDAGFEEVLIKPLSIAALHGAIRRFVASATHPRNDAWAAIPGTSDAIEHPTCGKLPIFDDETALRALNGRPEHVVAMRRMLLAELPQQAQRITDALRDDETAALRAELHKLLASAGFVGAARLQAAARELQAAPNVEPARRQFEGALADTLKALRDQASSG